MQADYDTLAQEKQGLSEKLADAEQQINDLISEISAKQEQQEAYASVSEKLAAALEKQQADKQELDSLYAELDSAQKQLEAAQQETQELREKLEANDDLDTFDEEASGDLRAQLEEAAEENEDLRTELENVLEQNEQLQSEIDRMTIQTTQKQSELQEKLHTAEQQYQILQTENKKLRQNLEEYKARMNAKRENAGAAYLQAASSAELLDKQEGTRFVHINFSEEGDLVLEHVRDPKTAEIALLRNGAMIPNPHFYPALTGQGETGEQLEILLPVFEMPELDDDKQYPVKALNPAVGEIRDRALHVKRKGRIEV